MDTQNTRPTENTTRAAADIARDYELAHIAYERAHTADTLRLIAGEETSEEQRAELDALKAKAQQLQQELAAAVQAEKLEQAITAARLAAALAVPAAPAPEPDASDDDDDDDDEEEEEPSEEEGYNVPTLRLDGTALGYDALPEPEELERVQVEFDAASNGYQSEADERAPLGWVNSAAIELDRDDDSITLSISVGDPRGAFCFTIRRATDGSLLMDFPTPADSLLHMPLRRLRDGLYQIGH